MPAESVESLCQKARQSVAQGSSEQAKQLYLQALGIRPESPDVHYGLATVCFVMNDLPSAAHHFREVTRLDPLRAGAYINLGAVYNRLDQLDEAIQALRRGIQLDTHRGEGYYNLGLVYRRKGQADLAIQAYREATRVNPRMADAHLNLANVYLEKHQLSLATAHYKQALEIRPGWEKAYNGLAQAEAEQLNAGKAATAAAESGDSSADKRLPQSGIAPPPSIDPNRVVDATLHAVTLTNMHKATIESENFGRNFLQVLENEIEPALKELSTALLYQNTSSGELDQCVQKFEAAVQNMRSAQRSLQSSIDRVRSMGEKLIKS